MPRQSILAESSMLADKSFTINSPSGPFTKKQSKDFPPVFVGKLNQSSNQQIGEQGQEMTSARLSLNIDLDTFEERSNEGDDQNSLQELPPLRQRKKKLTDK